MTCPATEPKVAYARVDPDYMDSNTPEHEFSPQQQLVVAVPEGEGGWLTCS